MMPPIPAKRKIALLIETSLASGRQILMGVSDFMQENDHWSVFQQTGILGRLDPEVLKNWEGDGIIARIADREILEIVRAKGLPVVDVLGNIDDSDFPRVISNDRKVGQLAIEHFQSRGYKRYAYFGLKDEEWSVRRGDAFANLAESQDYQLHRFSTTRAERAELPWNAYIEKIANWLKDLPKPISLLLCSDQMGPDLLTACDVAEVAVPSQVAILSVDNDVPFCEVCRPKLSSISANHRGIGYAASEILERLLASNESIDLETRIDPVSIITRQSTDTIALEDRNVLKALQVIRDEACHGINVDQIAALAGVSRSVLQRRFRQHLKTTINAVILDTKLNRAKELISLTNLDYLEIAEKSGFNHQEYLSYIFKKKLGLTPAQFRKQNSDLQS